MALATVGAFSATKSRTGDEMMPRLLSAVLEIDSSEEDVDDGAVVVVGLTSALAVDAEEGESETASGRARW